MNIIITGASSGIGYETAKYFAESSNHNLFLISRSKLKLHELKNSIEILNPNVNVVAIPFDLSFNDFNPLFQEIKMKCNRIDILLNNAGILLNKPFSDVSSSELQEVFNTNFFSVYKLIQGLLPLFNNPSHIVNIGSMGGFQGSSKFPGLSAYSASKAALSNLSECLAQELSDFGIRSNCLALGSVQTQMLNQAFPGYKAAVTPEQMAKYVVDFSLNGHFFYNGKTLPVSMNTP